MIFSWWVALFLLSVLFSPLAGATGLNASTSLANAGFYTLSWQGQNQDSGHRYELQESSTADFLNPRLIYSGPDTATVISGKANGVRFYRVRSVDEGTAEPWSDVVQVTVMHHSLAKAFMFLLTGLVVFIATLILVVRGVAAEGGEQA